MSKEQIKPHYIKYTFKNLEDLHKFLETLGR